MYTYIYIYIHLSLSLYIYICIGMGGLAEAAVAETSYESSRIGPKIGLGMTRLLAENGPQLVLQTSLLMARGESLLGQPALLVSVALSLGSGVKKALELTMAARRAPSWLAVLWGCRFPRASGRSSPTRSPSCILPGGLPLQGVGPGHGLRGCVIAHVTYRCICSMLICTMYLSIYMIYMKASDI